VAFTNLSSTARTHEVRKQIVAAITSGEFAPGHKLPSENDLSAALGVSRVSVREALRSIEAIGLIEIHHGRGSFVTTGPGTRYRTPFAEWLQVHREEVLDLMKVRGALDELAAAEAAASATDAQLLAVEQSQERFRAAARNPVTDTDELISADVAFHLAIAEASGSDLLLGLLDELNKLFTESRSALFAIEGRAGRSSREHDAIVSAIRSGNTTRARSAAARHLESVRRVFSGGELLARLGDTGAEGV
jgi:GntR family transcriptional regulator, transcriptional repressor for pyruvate dehydrogenase complex